MSFLCAHWKSDFKRWPSENDLWHHSFSANPGSVVRAQRFYVETWSCQCARTHTHTHTHSLWKSDILCPTVKLNVTIYLHILEISLGLLVRNRNSRLIKYFNVVIIFFFFLQKPCETHSRERESVNTPPVGWTWWNLYACRWNTWPAYSCRTSTAAGFNVEFEDGHDRAAVL